ncbi:hypothetical protein GCM10025867_25800 [Frondihabitans sucicola]|uniref:Uncharacterized protein n=1 Tax=Frondihabitans sucicola TaxID=1268041 RepID=A0ABM8GPI1_9MICO|nr:hypothetical protein GCM10025867_25800 [Frondihabitans sucicola]
MLFRELRGELREQRRVGRPRGQRDRCPAEPRPGILRVLGSLQDRRELLSEGGHVEHRGGGSVGPGSAGGVGRSSIGRLTTVDTALPLGLRLLVEQPGCRRVDLGAVHGLDLAEAQDRSGDGTGARPDDEIRRVDVDTPLEEFGEHAEVPRDAGDASTPEDESAAGAGRRGVGHSPSLFASRLIRVVVSRSSDPRDAP